MNNEIKIGTKIKALVDFPDGGGVKKGEVGVIIDAERDIAIADFPSQKNYYISYSYFGNGYETKEAYDAQENSKDSQSVDMLEIQRMCKEKYPIGSVVISIDFVASHVLKKDNEIYTIGNNSIWSIKGMGCLYKNGEWAELISLPEASETWTPKAGDWVEITYLGFLVTGNFKSGDILQVESFSVDIGRDRYDITFKEGKGKGFGKYKSSLSGDYLHKCMKKASSPIKEIEELPEHWCFKVTPENYKKFQHLRSLVNSIAGGYITSSKYSPKGWGHFYTNKPSGYIEIPFELFEKHYLYQQLPPHLVAAQIEDKLADFSDLRIGYCPSKDAESILSIKTTTKPKLTIIDIPTTQPIVIKLNKKIKYLIPKSI